MLFQKSIEYLVFHGVIKICIQSTMISNRIFSYRYSFGKRVKGTLRIEMLVVYENGREIKIEDRWLTVCQVAPFLSVTSSAI